MKPRKSFKYPDGCSVTILSAHEVTIEFQQKTYHFDSSAKPVFDYKTGEIVTEYSGLAADGNPDESWAIAQYSPKGFAPLHYHQHLTEDYYIVKGRAIVKIDDVEISLSTGEHIQIKPGQHHRVLNASEDKELVLIVKCSPSWTAEDYTKLPDSSAESIESRRFTK